MKSMLCCVLPLFIILSMFAGCSELNKNGDVEAVRKLTSVDYITAVNNQDAAAYSQLFADDVFWAPPNSPVCRSREEIGKSLQQNFDTSIFHLELTKPAEIQVFGSYAYSLAEASLTVKPKDGSPDISLEARVIWILQKQPDGWKISRQVYNFTKPQDK